MLFASIEAVKTRSFKKAGKSVPKEFGTLPGGPSPPGYAAWFLTKPAAIPPVSRPGGRGSWYKNQAHVLIFMILKFAFSRFGFCTVWTDLSLK